MLVNNVEWNVAVKKEIFNLTLVAVNYFQNVFLNPTAHVKKFIPSTILDKTSWNNRI